MKNLANALLPILLGCAFCPADSHAYTYTFVNTLDKPVTIEFCGIAMIGCSMFAGDTLQGQKEHVKEEKFGNFIRYREAQWLYGPQTIMPGKTAAYDFRGWSIGICVNIDSMKVSIDGGAFLPLKPFHVDSVYMTSVIQRLGNLGNKVEKLGDAVSKSDKQDAKVAGKVVGVLAGFLEPIADLYAVSACKDGTFIIGIDKNKEPVIQTSDF